MGISGRTTKRFIEGLPGREPPAPGEPETDPLLTDSLGTTFTLIAPGVWQSQDSGVTYTVRFPSPAAPLPAGARPSGMEGDALDLPITADEERQGFSSLPHVVMGMLDNWLDDFTDDTPPEVWQRIEFAERVVRRVHAASLASRPAPGADLAGMLDGRITAYLAGGGLWNPELANHDAVRDLLIDARAAFAQVAREREEAVDRGNRWKDLGQAADSERITAEIAQRAAESALATAQAETAALREALAGVIAEAPSGRTIDALDDPGSSGKRKIGVTTTLGTIRAARALLARSAPPDAEGGKK
jgi:hypothetical protein